MSEKRARWLALYVLCLGDLMYVLDANIVNVALPSIQADLGLSQGSLAWVVNAYLLTFGGFLLLCGRLGDLYGNRRVFLGGIVAFTISSVACGLAPNAGLLVAARAAQGIAGGAVSAVALALIAALFTDPAERAKAMGIFGFVLAGGGALGVLLGGVLTGLLSWHWIFWVNVPVGVVVLVLSGSALPRDRAMAEREPLDVFGAGLVTLALMVATYGIVGANDAGWTSARTLILVGGALVLLVGFVIRESTATHPLMPLRLFGLRNLSISQLVGGLWAAAMFGSFFLTSLYLQRVLGYDAVEVGLAYLPNCVVMAACSVGLSDRLVMRFGIRPPLTAGLALVGVGLVLLSRAPLDGGYLTDVLPAMVLLGVGAGTALNPVLLAGMGDVEGHEAGIASGVLNTSIMFGGALGLAVLVSVSSARSSTLTASGAAPVSALNQGLHAAFVVGAGCALVAAVIGGLLLRPKPMAEPADPAATDAADKASELVTNHG